MSVLVIERVQATLDGAAITIGAGSERARAIRIEGGAYATPFWIQTSAGLVLKVDSLPWQGVLPTGTVRLYSSDPSAGTLLFAHQWPTTGSAEAALRDTTNSIPWTADEGGGSANIVVTAASLGLTGWPTTNAFHAICDWPGSGTFGASQVVTITTLTSPSVGDELFFRTYIAVTAANPGDNPPLVGGTWTDDQMHPLEDGAYGGLSSANLAWRPTVGGNGTFECDFVHRISGANTYALGPTLSKAPTLYRLEWRVRIASATHFQLWPRVYSSAGVLLHDADDWTYGAGTLADEPLLVGNPTNPLDRYLDIQLGQNDTGSQQVNADLPVFAYGAFCIKRGAWCGPYNASIEEGGP